MEEQLYRLRREVDQTLSLHLAAWSQAVASYGTEDLTDYVRIAADLTTARTALIAAADRRRALDRRRAGGVAGGETTAGLDAPDDRTEDAQESVSRRITRTVEDIIEVDNSERSRYDRRT